MLFVTQLNEVFEFKFQYICFYSIFCHFRFFLFLSTPFPSSFLPMFCLYICILVALHVFPLNFRGYSSLFHTMLVYFSDSNRNLLPSFKSSKYSNLFLLIFSLSAQDWVKISVSMYWYLLLFSFLIVFYFTCLCFSIQRETDLISYPILALLYHFFKDLILIFFLYIIFIFCHL